MSDLNYELTFEALAKVKADSLSPSEQPTKKKQLVSKDTYQQRFIKYPHRATLHSYPAFLQAILFEARQTISSFIPHPFTLRVRGKPYIPQFYVVKNHTAEVIALTPDGLLNNPPSDLLDRFFKWENISFSVVAYDEVLTHEVEALNWLRLIQVLVVAELYVIDTRQDEIRLLNDCASRDAVAVGDLISPRRRGQLSNMEIALYRLLHTHRLETDLAHRCLNYDSEVRLCT